jgi:hypothetical protein
MPSHKIAIYYAWSRPVETGAPLEVIDNRFPALFESRRLFYPRFAEFADASQFDQGIGGFLDHIQKPNFTAFVEQVRKETGQPVLEVERVLDDGRLNSLTGDWVDGLDTLIIISFDSLRTEQKASDAEIKAMRSFLAKPGNLLVVCPHHEIGYAENLAGGDLSQRQHADFLHHGDRSIPPQQRFGGLARSLLAGLGLPVENRFGLRPAIEPDGSPAPIEAQSDLDRLGLLNGVKTLNHHPHLPQLERLGEAVEKMEVLARQRIDLKASPHPFTAGGRQTFDAVLQSRAGVFAGDVLVSDTTLWSSTAGGVESLRQLWTNVALRKFPA